MSRRSLSRREFLTGTAGVIGIGLLAACAPKATPAPEEPAVEPEPVEEEEAPVSEPAGDVAGLEGQEYVMWGLEYDPHVERYGMVTDAFEELTGAKAIIEPQGWPLETKVLAAVSAGVVPDVVCMMGMVSTPLYQQGVITAIDELVFDAAGVDPDEFFFPEALGAFTYQGKRYGVPLESNSTAMCAAARLDWIEEKGDEAGQYWPPNDGRDQFKSHEEIWSLAETLMQKDDAGNVTVWGYSTQGWTYQKHLSYMLDLGQFWWDEENEKYFLDSDESLAAANILVTEPVFNRGIETQLDMSHLDAILAGKVAVANGNSAAPGEAEKINLLVESCLSPSAVDGEVPNFVGQGGWGFQMPVQAEKKEVVAEFMKWMSTKDGQYIFSGIYGGAMPATPTVIDTDIYNGEGIVKRSKRRHLLSLPTTVYWGHGFGLFGEIMNRIIEGNLDQARIGEISAEEAVAKMQAEAEEHLAQFKAGTLEE